MIPTGQSAERLKIYDRELTRHFKTIDEAIRIEDIETLKWYANYCKQLLLSWRTIAW
jgi:hypothetical protein